MNSSFEYITTLEYRLKAANAQIQAFKSGEKYIRMQQEYLKELRSLEQKIRELENALSCAHGETVSVRNQWFEMFEELQKECDRKIAALLKKLEQMEKRAIKAERQRDEALDKVTSQRRKIYALETELEDEKGKNLKLRAQFNRDYENSSLPSSKSIRHKKISNSREKTGKKPGGQPGHKGHCRKKQAPTSEPVLLPPPQKVLDNADVYYNRKTGERVHADFPVGVVDDVNYGGSIKAFLFLLNNDCCTSIDKSRKFLSDLTDGKLNISKGMINKLSREFSIKSEQERKEMFADMLCSRSCTQTAQMQR